MSGEKMEQDKDCIKRCQQEFIDCVDDDHADCVPNLKDCTGAC